MVKPHLVLVDTLTQMCQALPKSTEEAASTRASVYRKLPSVFLAWFSLTLLPAMKAKSGMARNEREARTLVEALDALVKGEQLSVIMLLLGRLKALSSVVLAEGSRALAQQHELTKTNVTGILTDRDQRHAQRDLRDQQRLAERAQGAPLAGRADAWSGLLDTGAESPVVLGPNAEARGAGAANPKGAEKGKGSSSKGKARRRGLRSGQRLDHQGRAQRRATPDGQDHPEPRGAGAARAAGAARRPAQDEIESDDAGTGGARAWSPPPRL